MERTVITIPRALVRALSVNWDIDWRGKSVGQRTSATSQTVFDAFPRWVGAPTLHLRRDQVLQWRALRTAMQGYANIIQMPLVDPVGFDRVGAGGAFVPDGIPFSTGPGFSNGLGFAYDPIALASAAAARGATEIRIDVTPTGVAPKVGQIMSHDSWPFLVTWVSAVSANVYTLGIQMPLRAAIAVDDIIQLEGVGLFELADERGGNPTYGQGHTSRPEIPLREVLNR